MQQEVNLSARPIGPRNRLPRLDPGEAGVRVGAGIKFRAGLLGCVARGSLGYLAPGRYRLALGVQSQRSNSAGYDAGIVIELITCSRLICVHVLTRADLSNPLHQLLFEVPAQARSLEVRISALSSVEATIHHLGLESLDSPSEMPLSQDVRLQNWLPLFYIGPAGQRPEFGLEAEQGVTEALQGRSGCVISGPRWPLAPGSYTVTAVIELPKADAQSVAIGRLDIAADTIAIASAELEASQGVHDVALPFEVVQSDSDGFPPLIETCIFSNGTRAFRVRSLTIEPERTTSTARKRHLSGNLVERSKTFLSRPLERAIARSVAPLVARLEATITQIETVQDTQREREQDEWLERALGRIEGQALRHEQSIQTAAKQQRAAAEALGRRLQRLEEQASRQEQAIQALAEHQRAVGATLGQSLEGSDGQASRQDDAI